MRDFSFYRGTKVLVTGADGFIGSHLAEALASVGADVTALSLYNSFDSHGWLDDVAPQFGRQMTLVRGDVRDASFIRSLIRGHDYVFHLAALIAIPYSYVAAQSYVETNILGTLNVLEAAREHRPERVVVTSTSEVYGSARTMPIAETHPLQGQSPYSASKIGADMMAEAFVCSFQLPVVILRPFNTFGPRQSERAVIPTIIRQMADPACEVLRLGDTSTVRDFTFVDDTVAAFLSAAMSPDIEFGRPYNAGTGHAASIGDVVALLGDIIGCGKPVQREERRLRPALSEVRALLADSRRLSDDAAWRAEIPLRVGLSRTVMWWRDRLASGRVRHSHAYMT